MNTASTSIFGRTISSRPSSLHFALFTGVINKLAQDATANFQLSGFDDNYTTASDGTGINLNPGVYRAINVVTFAQPVTGTNASYCSININVAAADSIVQPEKMQTNAEFNGWPTNHGSYCSSMVDLYVPSGGMVTASFYNAIGSTISGITLKMSLKQLYAY